MARLGSPFSGSGTVYSAFGPAEQPGDEAVLAFIGRRRRAFAAHHAIDRFDRHLAGEGRRIGLPARNLALARLARGGGDVQRLLHGLIDRLGRQVRAACRCRPLPRGRDGRYGRSCVRAGRCPSPDRPGSRRPAARPRTQIRARGAAMLRHRQHRRDVVAGMRVVGGEERIVEIEFAHRDAIGPGRPFRLRRAGCLAGRRPSRRAPDGCACACARAVATGWRAIEAAATAALSMMRLPIISATSASTRTGSAATVGDLPGELIGAIEPLGGFVGADGMMLHGTASS